MCFDIRTINIRVSIRVRGLHLFFSTHCVAVVHGIIVSMPWADAYSIWCLYARALWHPMRALNSRFHVYFPHVGRHPLTFIGKCPLSRFFGEGSCWLLFCCRWNIAVEQKEFYESNHNRTHGWLWDVYLFKKNTKNGTVTVHHAYIGYSPIPIKWVPYGWSRLPAPEFFEVSHSRKKTIKTKAKVKKGCIHLGLFESVDSIHSFMILFHYFPQYVPIRSQVPLKTWCLNPPCSDPLGRAPWVWTGGSNATRPWEVIVPASGGTRPLICTLEISYSRYFQVFPGKRW